MWILLVLATFVLVPITIYLAWRYYIGFRITKITLLFADSYDNILKISGSKKQAFREAVKVYKNCPKLNDLTDTDWDRVSTCFESVQYPNNLLIKLTLKTVSDVTLKALRNEEFLKEFADKFGDKPL